MTDDELTPIARARLRQGWSKAEVCRRLRDARLKRGMRPPTPASLKRMYVEWERGTTQVTDWRDEFCEVFQLTAAELGFVELMPGPLTSAAVDPLELRSISHDLVLLLEAQTDHYRQLDRQLGAALIPQTSAHTQTMADLLHQSLPGTGRPALARALAEAAALAGWQSLDSGNPREAWRMHELAKSAAREGEDPAVLSHVSAQQAYALLDSGRETDAVQLAEHARRTAGSKVPRRLRAWLCAAEAEFRAAVGDAPGSQRLLDEAADLMPDGDADPELPFLFLNSAHLARWRGNCLARLGSLEAVHDLSSALAGIPEGTFARAEAGLRVDLAQALLTRGDLAEAAQHIARAEQLATQTGSARQRARISQLRSRL